MDSKYKGWFVRNAFFELEEQKVISLREVKLLAVIDNLTPDKPGATCWASNAHLAREAGVSVQQLMKMTRHLKEVGLLVGDAGAREVVLRLPEGGGGSPQTTGHSLLRSKSSLIHTMSQAQDLATECSIFPDEESKSKFNKLSTRLATALQKKRKLTSKKTSAWDQHFRKIVELDGVEYDHLKEVLIWYCHHFQDEYVPQAYSGKTFRDKFDRIEAAMYRDPSYALVDVEVTKRAENVAAESEFAPEVAQRVIDEYKLLRRDMRAVAKEKREFRTLVEHLMAMMLSPEEYAKQYLEVVRNVSDIRRVCNVAESKFFYREGATLTQEYSGSKRKWIKLMEAVHASREA